PHGDLVAAGRVHMVDLGVVRLPQSAPLRILVVLQDQLLVHGLGDHRVALTFSLAPAWLSEHLPDMVEAAHQSVDLASGVVQVERRTRGRGYSEPQVERACAVVADAYGDAERVVQDLTDIVRVDALQREGYGTAPHLEVAGTDDTQAGDLRQRVQGVGGQLPLVRLDGGHADRGQVVDGRAEADGLHDRRRARLELVRHGRVGRAVHPDRLDHLTAAEEGRHGVQQLAAAPQHADA